MIEHRLIERLVSLIGPEADAIAAGRPPDRPFIEAAVDFFRTYADRTHHGKEEHILFRDLAKKPLTPEHARIMDELVQEHGRMRSTVTALFEANDRYPSSAGAAVEIAATIRQLTRLYPEHIGKEDKRFFLPVMAYLNTEEQSAMLREFVDFDRQMIHERYRLIVDTLATRATPRT
jgi:hemerythrin-like domain-containing protein